VDDESVEEQRAAMMQVKLLSHRIANPKVRTLAEELLSAGTDMGVAENQSDAERQRDRAADAAIALLDRSENCYAAAISTGRRPRMTAHLAGAQVVLAGCEHLPYLARLGGRGSCRVR
jgi:hypothetical protein